MRSEMINGVMNGVQVDEISRTIQAAKNRYDVTLETAHGATNPQEIDKIIQALTEAHNAVLVALEKKKR
jgi:hypothetical protein